MIHKHTMLEADMISRRYRCAGKGQVYAVNNLSLKIHTGECHGIVGESGCGKKYLNAYACRDGNAEQRTDSLQGGACSIADEKEAE